MIRFNLLLVAFVFLSIGHFVNAGEIQGQRSSGQGSVENTQNPADGAKNRSMQAIRSDFDRDSQSYASAIRTYVDSRVVSRQCMAKNNGDFKTCAKVSNDCGDAYNTVRTLKRKLDDLRSESMNNPSSDAINWPLPPEIKLIGDENRTGFAICHPPEQTVIQPKKNPGFFESLPKRPDQTEEE